MAGKRTANLARIKHKKFVSEMIGNGLKPVEAYQSVYPDASFKTATVNSSKLMQTEEVQKELAKQAAHFTPDLIVKSIGEIALDDRKSEVRLRAWELLAKVRSLFKSEAPSQQINVLAQFDTPEARKELMNNNIQPTISEIEAVDIPNHSNDNSLGQSS